MSSCCELEGAHDNHGHSKRDWFYIFLLVVGATFYFGHIINSAFLDLNHNIAHIFHSFFELVNIMSWGLLLGIIFVGLIGQIPREFVASLLGAPGKKTSILRATAAGVMLDLCSHGILLVGMKLYERGASLGQVMAFLIASPWNSFSLTIILFTLIGLKWTILFIVLSGVIAVLSGFLFEFLVQKKILPKNPHSIELSDDFHFFAEAKKSFRKFEFKKAVFKRIFIDGFKDSKMIIKWIVLGAILSSLIKVFVDTEVFQTYFGPSLLGLGATLLATTLIEVCSEGSAPIAADLMSRAQAPGNSFTFLMAGVSTDYTEILSLKSTTKSWKVALFLPLITVPQVLFIGWLLNIA